VRDWIRGFALLPGDDPRPSLAEVPPGDYYEQDGVLFPAWQRVPRPEGDDG
jgi:hypothetical protein